VERELRSGIKVTAAAPDDVRLTSHVTYMVCAWRVFHVGSTSVYIILSARPAPPGTGLQVEMLLDMHMTSLEVSTFAACTIYPYPLHVQTVPVPYSPLAQPSELPCYTTDARWRCGASAAVVQ